MSIDQTPHQSYAPTHEVVFENAELPEGNPHIDGVLTVMHGYVDGMTTNANKEHLMKAVDAWGDRAYNSRISLEQATELYHDITADRDRAISYKYLGLSESTDSVERQMNAAAADIVAAYDLTRFAARYVDEAYGANRGAVEVSLAPDADADKFILAKLSTPSKRSRRVRVPLEAYFAGSRVFDSQADSRLHRLGEHYRDEGRDFSEDKTKRALEDVIFMSKRGLSARQKEIVRAFRDAAVADIINQDFESYEERFNELALASPEAIGWVKRNEMGLTHDDVADLRAYREDQERAERHEAFVLRLGGFSSTKELKDFIETDADEWTREHAADIIGGSFRLQYSANENPTTITFGQLVKTGHGQPAFQYQLEDGGKTSAMRTVIVRKLMDLGIISQLREGEVVSAPEDRRVYGNLHQMTEQLGRRLYGNPARFSASTAEDLLKDSRK